jgi:ribosome-associated translation inhibitor RaiA
VNGQSGKERDRRAAHYRLTLLEAEAGLFVQINTDNQIHSDAEANERLEGRVRDRLKRYEERLTHVEIHVSDTDGPRHGGNDKRVTLEARPTGRDPIAVHAEADRIDDAVADAANKAARALERMFGKLTNRKGH